MSATRITIDGNEAAARVAYRLSEVIAIYPITPSTPMGEQADAWAAEHRPNLWGSVPHVIEMQSEGGAAGALHGALQTGALATTFTASQGLLLMIPNMYKIAGELTPAVFHVAARALAAQSLSIFGDHSDVMACRATGWAMLASRNVQEAQDMAAIAHAATLATRIPFLHFFDGFRTSHQISKIDPLSDDDLRALVNDDLIRAHRQRGLAPEHPSIRGTAQNPDVYFQGRETVNRFYQQIPTTIEQLFATLATRTGRNYQLVEYRGAADAERVIILIGSAAETAAETAEILAAQGEQVGVVNIRLFRPFPAAALIAALPRTVKSVAVLDRTKEPGSEGEPLFLDVVAALYDHPTPPIVVGGRYGLGSKEFTPAMVKAIFDELNQPRPKHHFTIGITDDVAGTSLPFDPSFSIEDRETVRCLFYGLGSDGTVGANKSAIKIIGEETPLDAQGYFVYDSKKSGSMTVSHLRFGPNAIRAPYLIERAGFVACSQFGFLERIDILERAEPGAIVLLNSPFGPDLIWDQLPRSFQQHAIEKQVRLFVIDADQVAREAGIGKRVNTVMQTCFFALSGVLPRADAIARIKASVKKNYSKRGMAVVEQNERAIDAALDHLYRVDLQGRSVSLAAPEMRPAVPANAPTFIHDVLGTIIAGHGDSLPVSALPADGVYPTATARWEKRNLATEIPVWDAALCIQCGKCAFVCPHAALRAKAYPADQLDAAPEGFKSASARFRELPGMHYTIQVAPEDCTSCGLCVEACPVKDKQNPAHKAINMMPQPPLLEQERTAWDFFLGLPDLDQSTIAPTTVKNSQLMIPLFEFSGACAGCGETPYLKLVTQLFGDRMVIANATGCSSIYGGNLPTTPWATNKQGVGPAWANSLFEDNAEFGLGMRLALDQRADHAHTLVHELADVIGEDLAQALLHAPQQSEAEITRQRQRVAELRQRLTNANADPAKLRELESLADNLVRHSVWIIGGDGWAYDIGFGGLDHVLASGRNINVLVLDTEVYSNTGGQASKATPRGAVARFAAEGRQTAKKDLGLLAMSYGSIYVARIAMGADDTQTLKALLEAESYNGPSLVIAYSHCIAHGIDMRKGLEQQRLAVKSGYWPLYRYDPRLAAQNKPALMIDSPKPSVSLAEYLYGQDRFKSLVQQDPIRAEALLHAAEQDIAQQWDRYQRIAEAAH
ncbi:MAG: pyruvate:ferredoxin (flavodoxin) oxidoreductase [Roseiflexaceae bacterium]